AYVFRPTAADPDGDALTFSVTNLPSWATFNSSTGQISGTPSAGSAGTTMNIVISVSDGKSTASLAPFSVVVNQVAMGSATLAWMPPTTNTDGTTLTNLAGYYIYYGTSSGALTNVVQVTNPGVSSYVLGNLSPATYYFEVNAYTSTGTESTSSNVTTKVVH
ncbi:MAG: putative Ig domain-containing protein, partial [Steroidobacteraceae bacterium]